MNQNTDNNGNDFGLDHIVFAPTSECLREDSVLVNVVLHVDTCDSYTWTGGTQETYTTSDIYTYSFEDENGHLLTDTLYLTVTPSPSTPSLSITPNTSCISNNGSITVTSPTGDGYTYSIDGENFQSDNSFEELAAGSYTVIVTNAAGCSSYKDTTINAIGNNVTVEASANSPCLGDDLELTATSNTEGATYVWTYPDNTTHEGAQQTISGVTASDAGSYSVVATDSVTGCSNFNAVDATIQPLPIITISGETELCYGQTSTLIASGADSYIWSTGEMGESISVNTANTYAVIGTDANGCVNSQQVTVTVGARPTIEQVIPDYDFLGCNIDINNYAPTVNDFAVYDGCNPDAQVSIDTAVSINTDGCHIKTQWDIHYTNSYGQEAEGEVFVIWWTFDTISPVITGTIPDTILYGCDALDTPAAATSVAELRAMSSDLSIVDNCSSANALSVNYTDEEPVSIGSGCELSIVRTYTVTDDCGNSSNLTQNIMIEDTTKPSFAVPEDVIICRQLDESYDADPSITGEPTSLSDNCVEASSLTISYTDIVTSHITTQDTIIRTWIVSDNCNESLQTQRIFMNPVVIVNLADQTCAGEQYNEYGFHIFVNADTTLTDTLTSMVTGCDSIVMLNLTVNYPNTGDTTVFASDEFTWYGETYYETPVIAPTHTFTNAVGCDSVVTLHLTIGHSNTGDTTAFACDEFTWYDSTYYETPMIEPTHTFINASGSDSVVTLHLTIGHTNTGDTTAFACNEFTWYGETYYETPAVAPTFTFTNASGCDSVVTLHLTIGYSNTGDTNAVACDEFTWYGETYYETPAVALTHTFTNTSGCDSVVTLHLTINHSNTGDTNAVVCNSFDWYEHTDITTSGEYTHTFTNAAGCDSVVTLHLTVNYGNTGDTTAFACNEFTWYGETYDETPAVAPTYTFTNAFGCDSVVTLHLTIGHPNTGDTTAFACDEFTWYGETYYETPVVAPTYTFTNTSGCDSVVTLHLTIGYSNTGDTNAVACNEFTWYGETYYETPIIAPTHTFTNVSGCDSTVTLHLTVWNSDTTSFDMVSCYQYVWNGTVYDSTGDYTQTLTNIHSCDSVVTMHLVINDTIFHTFDDESCNTYAWNETTYTVSGDYVQTFPSSLGCDSVVTLHLTLWHDTAVV